jgi:hypothetical protein
LVASAFFVKTLNSAACGRRGFEHTICPDTIGQKDHFMSNQLSASSIKRLLIVAAAGVAALSFIPRSGAADQGAAVTNQASQAPTLPDGFIQKDENAASGVKSTLVGLTQRAVTKDSYNSFFSSFLSELASRDKTRAQEFKGVDQEKLNATIGQIQTGWRAKYNQDFDVSDKNLVFNEQFPIVQGEVSDPTAAANNWPASGAAGEASVAASNSEQQDCNKKELTAGRAVAIMRIPAANGFADINVSLTYSTLSGWYVDLPVDRTGEKVYNDLTTHLDYVVAHQDYWPADVNEGYRMVARQVVAALYGVPSHDESPRASAQ